MTPVKASGFFNSNLTEAEQKALMKAGITPVNDVFYDLWGNTNKINILYGGYGSGKSVFIQTLLLQQCRTQKYFKCFYGRKILEDVRGSVHSKFVSLIEEFGLQDEFRYSKENNGSMIITHKNGNKFIPFGASKPDSLKSIDDPTHFFLEEMDQFSLQDFGVIISRLRTPKALTQLYGAFNTAKVFPDHWIKKTFFANEDDEKNEAEKNEAEKNEAEKLLIEAINELGVKTLFCNYTDNYFIDQEDYYNKLVLGAAGDIDVLEASTKGAWGSYKPSNPFATQYAPSKHESRDAVFNPNRPIIIVFDFNLDPFSCIFAQMWRDEHGEHCHVVDEIEINAGNIDKICDQIKIRYGTHLSSAFVTGDSMGKRRSLEQPDNASNYKLIMRKLGLNEKQLRLPNNPKHSNSRTDVNYFLHHFPDFKINPSKCSGTCRDMRNTECDAFGEIKKKNRKDENQRADFLDCVRYLVNTFCKKWIDTHQKIIRK